MIKFYLINLVTYILKIKFKYVLKCESYLTTPNLSSFLRLSISFIGSCYKVMPEKAQWNISKSICEIEKAELSSIRSNEEWDFVKGWSSFI